LLLLVQIIIQGFVGDRLLFKKAYSVVTDPAMPDDPARFEALGRPHNWAIWLPLVIVGVVIIAVILI